MTELRDNKPHTPAMHCNANSSASSSSHHTLFMQRQEQATSERLSLALEHYSKWQHLEPHFSAFCDLFLLPFSRPPFVVSLLFRHFLNSHPIPSFAAPPPDSATLQAHRSPPLAHFPRRHTILSAVFVSTASVSLPLCRWPIVLLACVLPLPCSPRRSRVKAVAQGVCQQKAVKLSMELSERSSRKKDSEESRNKRAVDFQLTITDTGTGNQPKQAKPLNQRSSLRHCSPSISTCRPGVRALLRRWPAICLNCPQTDAEPKFAHAWWRPMVATWLTKPGRSRPCDWAAAKLRRSKKYGRIKYRR